jgi:hypothetical protein
MMPLKIDEASRVTSALKLRYTIPKPPDPKKPWQERMISRGETVQEVISFIAKTESANINTVWLGDIVLWAYESFDDYYESGSQLFFFSEASATDTTFESLPDGITMRLKRKCHGNVHNRHVIEVTSGSFEKDTYGANPHSKAFGDKPDNGAKNVCNFGFGSCFCSAHRKK